MPKCPSCRQFMTPKPVYERGQRAPQHVVWECRKCATTGRLSFGMKPIMPGDPDYDD